MHIELGYILKKEQATLIDKTIGCCRLLYNLMLAERKEIQEQNKENKDIIKEKAVNYIKNSSWFTNFHNNFKKFYKSTSIETYFDNIPPRCYVNTAFI